jgi:hypothetical protein
VSNVNESNVEGYEKENREEDKEEYEVVLTEKFSKKEIEIWCILIFSLVCISIAFRILGSINSDNDYGYRRGALTSDIQMPQTTKLCFEQYEVKGKENFKDIWKNNVVGYNYKNTLKLILENNKFKSTESLYKGQLIYIPTMTNPNCSIYTVKTGDNVYSIAEEFFKNINIEASIKIIKESNGKVGIEMLEEGQRLLIPIN